jgi:hypothetical protein
MGTDNGIPQASAGSMRQDQLTLTQTRILVGIHNIMIAGFTPRIAHVLMAIATQLACTLHCFAKLTDALLHTLGTETGIAALGPLLPALFAGPLEVPPPYAVMAFNKITPQTGGFFPRCRKGAPFRACKDYSLNWRKKLRREG